LLTISMTAFSSPGVEFGPLVLARPLWALLLLHSWQLIGQGRRNAWFAWSIEAGLLLLTTSVAIGLLLLLVGFALATARGRRTLMSFDPLFALLVIVVLVLPYLVWLVRADTLALPHWPAIVDLSGRALHWAALLGGLLLAISGIVLLVVINSGWFGRKPEEAPIIYRPPVDPLARDFVYFFAIAPALAGSLISGLFDLDRVAGGAGIALLMLGLAAIAMADIGEIQRNRRRRGLARIRHGGHAAGRYRAAISRPGAGSAARLRVAGHRSAAAIADWLGHRAAEDAVSAQPFSG
jgi:hypothetical protein